MLTENDFFVLEYSKTIEILKKMKELDKDSICFTCNEYFNKNEGLEYEKFPEYTYEGTLCPFCYSKYHRPKIQFEKLMLKPIKKGRYLKKEFKQDFIELGLYDEVKQLELKNKTKFLKKNVGKILILFLVIIVSFLTLGVGFLVAIFCYLNKNNERGVF